MFTQFSKGASSKWAYEWWKGSIQAFNSSRVSLMEG